MMQRFLVWFVLGVVEAPISAYIILLLMSPFLRTEEPWKRRTWLLVTLLLVAINTLGLLLFVLGRR
jgi:hypothetical protein